VSSVFLYKGKYHLPGAVDAQVPFPTPRPSTLPFVVPALIVVQAIAVPVAPAETVPYKPERPLAPPVAIVVHRIVGPPPTEPPTNMRPYQAPPPPPFTIPAIIPGPLGPPPLAEAETIPYRALVLDMVSIAPVPQAIVGPPPSEPPTNILPYRAHLPLAPPVSEILGLGLASPPVEPVELVPYRVPGIMVVPSVLIEPWHGPFPFPDEDRGATPKPAYVSPVFYRPPELIPWRVGTVVPFQDITWATDGGTFKFVIADWSRATFKLRAHMRQTTGTVYARVYDVTASAEKVQINTTSGTFVFVLSDSTTLTDGSEYRVDFGKAGADAGEWDAYTVFMV
jgi:hypothetical protein